MQPVTNPDTFIAFPDHIVPAATVPLEKLAEEVKKIDGKLSIQYAKLKDIKSKQGEKSKAWNTVTKKIQELERQKEEMYSENPQWEWAVQFANACINYGRTNLIGQDEYLYSYANARVGQGEFSHITELYAGTMGKALPAYLRQVNQCPAIVNRIVGEADATGIKYSVSVINSDAVNAKLDKYSAEMAEMITKYARQKAEVNKVFGTSLEDGDEWSIEQPQFEELNFSNYQIDEEVMIKRGLDYLMRKPDLALRHKFSHMGLRNYIITAKMCFEVWDDIADPNITPVDSRDLFYILNPNSPFIHHGMAAGRYFAATPQDLIDMMPELSADAVEELRSLAFNYQGGMLGAELMLRHGCFEVKMKSRVQYLYLHCWRFNFRATKRVRVKIIENKYDADNPHIMYVSDNDNDENATYEYRFVEEIWEGYRYGNGKFYQLRPVPGQHIVGDYLEKKTLNFVGIVDPNPSLVQLIQPFESLRIQVFYAIERLMAQVQGKILCVDEANESDDADNAYNMKVYSIYRYNSAKEGDMQLQGVGGAKNLNKPEVLDLGLSSAITDLIRFIGFLDQNIAQITGITGARRGEIKSDTGLGQMEQSNMASAMATQPYFSTYYTVLGMTLEKLCEQMQRSWGGKDIVKYFLGEKGMELLNLMKESEWHLQRYGIFIENGANDEVIKAKIENMANSLMPIANDPDLALALIKMMNTTSAKEAERVFEKGIEAMRKFREQSAQAAQEGAAMQQQMAQMMEENKNLREKIKAAASTQVAEINKSSNVEVTAMKLDHKEDEQTVKKKDRIDEMLAKNELNNSNEENNFRRELMLNSMERPQ